MTAAPAPKTPPVNVFAVKPGQNAILLVPFEEGPREKLTELFYEQGLMADSEDDRKERGLPIIKNQINLKRLREDDVLFTAIVVPKKYAPKKQVSEYELKISNPIPIKGLIPNMGDVGGEDVKPDFTAVIEQIQSSKPRKNGDKPGCHPFTVKVSQDQLLCLRTL